MTNIEERLDKELDQICDSAERQLNIREFVWFRLASFGIRVLIVIASALWDK